MTKMLSSGWQTGKGRRVVKKNKLNYIRNLGRNRCCRKEKKIEAAAGSDVWAHPFGVWFPTHLPVGPKLEAGNGVDPVDRAGNNPKSAITNSAILDIRPIPGRTQA